MADTPVSTVLDDGRDGLSQSDLGVIENVEQYGFHWMSIGHSKQDEISYPEWRNVPGWSYTIGLYGTYGHPEFVVFELEKEIVGTLFWDLAREIRSGRSFAPGRIYSDALPSFEGQTCGFEPVSPAWIASLFGFGSWFYKGADFPVLQYLWPDRNGNFVWDPAAAATIRDVQPDLSSPPEREGAPPRRRC